MSSLLQRMKDVMKARGWSEREWARRAGLKEEANVNQIIRALRNDPDPEKVAGSAELFVKLAKAANVSLDWLLGGRGSPYSFTVDVHDDPRYPSRARVIGVAHLLGFSEGAIRALLEHAPDRDPGPDYWLRVLQAEQVKAAAAPDSPSEKVRK
jgi:transcriptional regulator with XRE-family HTH domain